MRHRAKFCVKLQEIKVWKLQISKQFVYFNHNLLSNDKNISCRSTSSRSVESSLDSQDVAMEICSESTEGNYDTDYQRILFEAYSSVGEPDAFYGSGVSTDLKARIYSYEQEKHWGKALSKEIQ